MLQSAGMGQEPLARKPTGAPPKLTTQPELRAKLIESARLGRSRLGTAQACGVAPNLLTHWLAKGKAEPDAEPYGSFAREFCAASREIEGRCLSVLEQRLAYLEMAPAEEISADDVRIVAQLLASRWPKEHGTGALREAEPEIDVDAYHREHGASVDALQSAIRQAASGDSPVLAQAIFAEGSLLLALLRGELEGTK